MKLFLPFPLILLAMSLVAHEADAVETVEVVSMDLGSCWLKRDEIANSWKIASFNDNTTFYLLPDSELPPESKLERMITEKLRTVFGTYAPSRFRVDLHCGGGGHQLLISVFEGPNPVCVWARRSEDSNASLKIQNVFPSPDATPDSPCEGVLPGKLLVNLREGAPGKAIVKHLQQNERYRRVVETAEYLSVVGYIVMNLKPSHSFHEKEVKILLENDPFLRDKMKGVVYDRNTLIVGEKFLLQEGNYPGFLSERTH